MNRLVAHWGRRSRGLMTARYVLDNYLRRWRSASGRHEATTGTTHDRLDLEDSLAYIDRVVGTYVGYLPVKFLDGARVLEVGPGDSLGVALGLAARGAERVTALDKFYAERRLEKHVRIYRAMRERLDAEERRRFDRAVRLEGDRAEFDGDRVEYVYGVGIEDAGTALAGRTFDAVVSTAVIQYIHEIERALEVMDAMLVPGGWAIHRIALGDIGMFSTTMEPFTYLTIPESLWGHMTSHAPRTNRRRSSFYRDWFTDRGYATRILVRRLYDGTQLPEFRERPVQGEDFDETHLAAVRRVRGRLAAPFRDCSDEDLLVGGIDLIARKPGP